MDQTLTSEIEKSARFVSLRPSAALQVLKNSCEGARLRVLEKVNPVARRVRI